MSAISLTILGLKLSGPGDLLFFKAWMMLKTSRQVVGLQNMLRKAVRKTDSQSQSIQRCRANKQQAGINNITKNWSRHEIVTTCTKFDTCCQRYIATGGKKYNMHICVLIPELLGWNCLQIAQLSIRSGTHNLFRRFLDFCNF